MLHSEIFPAGKQLRLWTLQAAIRPLLPRLRKIYVKFACFPEMPA